MCSCLTGSRAGRQRPPMQAQADGQGSEASSLSAVTQRLTYDAASLPEGAHAVVISTLIQ